MSSLETPFAPTFALTAVVVVGWTVNEAVRLRSRGWNAAQRYGTTTEAPRQLVQPAAPSRPMPAASNDERRQREAA